MTERSDAIAALGRLGLSKYEAEVFIALESLETGGASDVDRITDVPRSQVYGAAERLEERGLIEIAQSSPIRYRAIDLDAARDRLRARIDREQAHAFEYLDRIEGSNVDSDDREDVWTVRGRESVTDRITELLDAAETRAVLGIHDPSLFDPVLEASVEDALERGVSVTVVDTGEPIAGLLDVEGVTASPPFVPHAASDRAGRVFVADDDTMLISVLGADEDTTETAIWSSGTGFATVLLHIVDGWLERTDT